MGYLGILCIAFKSLYKGEGPMEDKILSITTIDDYIMQFPIETQELLFKLRDIIRQAAPQAKEKISYQMPTFT